jgi:hypothetical protein
VEKEDEFLIKFSELTVGKLAFIKAKRKNKPGINRGLLDLVQLETSKSGFGIRLIFRCGIAKFSFLHTIFINTAN